MNSVEFTTRIEHGVIHLPKELEEFDNTVAHVKVTVEESAEQRALRKQRLIAAFRRIQEADVFRDIEDPVEWQRKLRDEWE